MNAIDKKKKKEGALGNQIPERYTLFLLLHIFKILMKIKIRSRKPLLVLNVFLEISNHLKS